MRVAVIGAGVGGLAAAVRLAALGHAVTVVEQAATPGGKAGRLELDGYRFDTGPSLVTMPAVLRDLFAAGGARLEDELELLPVEPVTRYRFPDGSEVELSADLDRSHAALEAWSPGAGEDWRAFMATCDRMWAAAEPVLNALPPWPPRRARPGDAPPDPRAFLRVRPWETLRELAAAHARDPRLRLVIERFATYAGADPRRAPAVLALAGYVEHAFGAWHPRGGVYGLVEALVRRLDALGGELRLNTPARAIGIALGRARAVETDDGRIECDAVVCNTDALTLARDLLPGRVPEPRGPRSLSGYVLMLGLRGRTPGLTHHTIAFPGDYDAEFDDIFGARRPVRDPTLYISASCVTDPGEAPQAGENWFVLVNAPHERPRGPHWDAEAEGYDEVLLDRLAARGFDVRERIALRARRTPADLERETGAPGGAIYGTAPRGRVGTLRRPGNVVRGVKGLLLVGGTTHPGGGLPLVVLSAKVVADEIGPA